MSPTCPDTQAVAALTGNSPGASSSHELEHAHATSQSGWQSAPDGMCWQTVLDGMCLRSIPPFVGANDAERRPRAANGGGKVAMPARLVGHRRKLGNSISPWEVDHGEYHRHAACLDGQQRCW
jgi:hypothetical protein